MLFALLGCGLLGFLAGLFCFKRTERWCSAHGVVKRCPLCEPLGSYPETVVRKGNQQ